MNGSDLSGPDNSNLQRLAGMLPGFVQARAAGKLQRLGKNRSTPANCCRICGSVWGAGRPDEPLRHIPCPECEKKMAEGQVAIVCGNRFAWVNSKSLQNEDGTGDIFYVSPDVFDSIEKEHKKPTDENNPADR